MSPRHLNALVLALLTLIWGTTWAAIRIGLEDIPPLTGAAVRFTIASALLLVVAWVRGVRLGASPVERRLWWLNALLSFSTSYGLVYWAEQYVPSGLTAVIFATYTLFVVILAHFFLPGERITRAGTVGVVVAFGGVALLFSEDLAALSGPGVARAAALLLLAPLVSAIAQVTIKRWGEGIHPLSLTAVPMGMTAGILGALALLVEGGRPVRFHATAVASIVYLAIFGSAIAFSLWFWLLARMRASRLALLTYMTPVVAVLVGTLVLGEPFTLRIFAGSAAVLGGVVLAARPRWRRRPTGRS